MCRLGHQTKICAASGWWLRAQSGVKWTIMVLGKRRQMWTYKILNMDREPGSQNDGTGMPQAGECAPSWEQKTPWWNFLLEKGLSQSWQGSVEPLPCREQHVRTIETKSSHLNLHICKSYTDNLVDFAGRMCHFLISFIRPLI